MESLIGRIAGSLLFTALDMSVTIDDFFYRYRRVLLYLVLALDVTYLCTILIFLRA
jgi:hypothetical protein